MKYHMEEASKQIWKHHDTGVKSEEIVEMAYELFEHLMDIRNNYRDGYSIEEQIKEFEDGEVRHYLPSKTE